MIRLLPVIVWSQVLIVSVLVALLLIILLLIAKRKYRLRWKHTAPADVDYEKELLQSELELNQHMMDNLTYEMRENIGQSLSLAKLQLSRTDGNDQEKRLQNLKSAKATVTRAIHDLLGLLHNTNNKVPDQGILAKTLETDLENIGKRKRIQTAITGDVDQTKTYYPEHPILIRLIQEWLYWLAGRPEVKSITLNLQSNPDRIIVTIKAITAGDTDPVPHEMSERLYRRAKMIGATLSSDKNNLGVVLFSIYFPLTKTLSHG